MRPKEGWSEAHQETVLDVLAIGLGSTGDLETGTDSLRRLRRSAWEECASGSSVLLPLRRRFSGNT